MRRFALGCMLCLSVWPAVAAQQQERFLTATITDIGRPYSVIDGVCFFEANPRLTNPSTAGMLESALQAASKRLNEIAKKAGADALVGMQVTPVMIPDPLNPRDVLTNSGVYLCGTLVKFNEKR